MGWSITTAAQAQAALRCKGSYEGRTRVSTRGRIFLTRHEQPVGALRRQGEFAAEETRLGALRHVSTRISVLSTFIADPTRIVQHDVAANISRKGCIETRTLNTIDIQSGRPLLTMY
jgi:hypothetical protein